MQDVKIFDLSTGEQCRYPFVLPKGVHYDPDAVCPRWDQFIDEITCGDITLQTYLQRMVGYCMTDSTAEKVMFVLLGNGGNGKSTFTDIIRMMMGEYARHGCADFLYGKPKRRKDKNYDGATLSRLKDCRLLVLDDPDSNEKLCASTVKRMVSDGDVIVARELYREAFEYIPKFKIVVTTNWPPEVDEDMGSTMKHVCVIPFLATFCDVRDTNLLEKLGYELPGILNWALEGAAEWYEHGLPGLTNGGDCRELDME